MHPPISLLLSSAVVLLTAFLHGKETPQGGSGESAAEIRDAQRPLQPGEYIFIHVLEVSETPSRHRIPEDGIMAYPDVKPFTIRGLTCLEAATLIARQLSQEPQFSEYGGPIVRVTRASPPPRTPAMQELDASVVLKKGDWVDIQFLESQSTPGEGQYQVDANGRVMTSYLISYDGAKAAGLTCRDLAYSIKKTLEDKGYPKATILVRKLPPPVMHGCPSEQPYFLVMGAVAREGKQFYLLGQDLRVSEAIRMAGGIRPGKKATRILIIRKTPLGNRRILVHPMAALGQGKPDHDLFLRRDDVVVVE